MLESVVIIFSCLWAILFYKVRDIFSPWSITLLIWIAIIVGYLFIDHGLFKVTDQFGTCILLWCICFSVAGFITFKLTPSYNGPEWAVNVKIVSALAKLALIITPFALYKAVSFALSNGSENLLYAMRIQIIDPDSGFSLGPIAYFVHVIYTLLFISADSTGRTNRKFLFFCLTINMIFFFVVMSKLVLFIGLLSTLYLFYTHKKVRLRTIVLSGVVFLALGLFFTQLRTTTDGDTEDTFTIMELIGMYLFSPVVSFCYETPCVSQFWGYETFRPVYHIMEVMGFNFHGSFDPLRPYVYVPIPTNVYTMMAPFFNDFGYYGIAFFAAFEGIFFSWVYKKASTGHTIARNLYAYLVAILGLQFFDEQFFAGLSNVLQIVVLITLCHVSFKWNPQDKGFINSKNLPMK